MEDFDVQTIRQLYTEAQNWARHYEQLIATCMGAFSVQILTLPFGLSLFLRQAQGERHRGCVLESKAI
jgi:hypothetical protein